MSVYNIPLAMRQRKQWMLAGPDKRPVAYDGDGGTYAGSKIRTDQWMTFDMAVELGGEFGMRIGYCSTPDDPFTIIDLDNKPDRVYDVDAEDLKTQMFMNAAETTYVELSQSLRGVHIVVEGKLAHDFNAQSAGIECYANKGFVIMTGIMPTGCVPRDPSKQQPMLDWLSNKYRNAVLESAEESIKLDGEQITNASPDELALDRQFGEWVETWKNKATIDEWLEDRPGDDRSVKDMRVMQLLVEFTRNRLYPDESAVRMFLMGPRGKLLGRKNDPQQYVTRTLVGAKARVAAGKAGSEGLRAMADKLRDEALAKANPAPNVANPALPAPVAAPVDEFRFLRASDLKAAPPTDWLIKNLLIHEGIACVFGESGSGKSFLMLDMIAAIAEGKEKWFDQRIKKQVPVCCLALEGQGGLRKRVVSWEKGHGREFPESILFFTGDFSLRGRDLSDHDNKARLERFCRALNKDGLFGGLIVIDTLAQASNGADENSAKDMNSLIDGMKFLRHATGSTVIVVHHAKKAMGEDGSGQARGSSVLKGAMDAEIEVSRSIEVEINGETRLCRGWIATKVKDAADGVQKPFDLEDATLGLDVDGEMESGKYVKPIITTIIEVDESTGEMYQSQSAPQMARAGIGRKAGSGGGEKRRKGREAPRAGSDQAPAVTRPSGGQTWSAGEYAQAGGAGAGSGAAARGRPKGGGAQQKRIIEAVRAACAASGGKVSYERAQMAVDTLSPSGAHQAIKNMTRAFEKLLGDGEYIFSSGDEVWV